MNAWPMMERIGVADACLGPPDVPLTTGVGFPFGGAGRAQGGQGMFGSIGELDAI